jgi:hypothetical protein
MTNGPNKLIVNENKPILNEGETSICSSLIMGFQRMSLNSIKILKRYEAVQTKENNPHSLTHGAEPLLEKLPIVQLLENFPTFYGTRRFTTPFT